MSNLDNDLKEIIQDLNSLIQKASLEVNGKEISEKLAESLKRSIQIMDTLQKLSEENIYDNLKSSRILLRGLGRNLIASGDMTLAKIGTEIDGIMKKIGDFTNSRTVVFSHSTTNTPRLHAGKEMEKTPPDPAKKIENLLQEIENRHLIKEADLTRRIAELNANLESLEGKVKERLDKVDELYNNTDIDLKSKLDSVNGQMGTITAATMAKDYAKFSSLEKKIADKYRDYSLLAMFGLAVFVSFSLWQVATQALTLTESIIRLSFVLIISAPAAYLTRESARHRVQENLHRQTQLDLRAITPYIASLSPTEQSQIKTQIALRLFGARNGQTNLSEGVPINTNDLLLKLLDKVDLSSKPDKTL